jgi:hypothetical protein
VAQSGRFSAGFVPHRLPTYVSGDWAGKALGLSEEESLLIDLKITMAMAIV